MRAVQMPPTVGPGRGKHKHACMMAQLVDAAKPACHPLWMARHVTSAVAGGDRGKNNQTSMSAAICCHQLHRALRSLKLHRALLSLKLHKALLSLKLHKALLSLKLHKALLSLTHSPACR
jgi:hypothetical protein